MLKITKNQIVKGQKVVVCDLNKSSEKYSDLSMSQSEFKSAGYKDGDELTVEKVSGGMVYFTNPNGKKCSYFWSWFKSVTMIPEGETNLGSEKIEYVIFYNGKKYKPKKYSDVAKVKAALLVIMGYHDLFYNESKKYLDNCPEHEYLQTPEWLGSGDVLTRNEFSKVEVYEWSSRNLGKKVEDFNPLDFYDEQMFFIKISSKFGSAARELFKKVTDDHKFMFVFMHEDYKQKYPDYESLTESDIIKNTLKSLKLKNTKKATKMGKTAIAVESASDVIKIMNTIPTDSKFLILDMRGNELERRDNDLFIMEAREEKLNSILG